MANGNPPSTGNSPSNYYIPRTITFNVKLSRLAIALRNVPSSFSTYDLLQEYCGRPSRWQNVQAVHSPIASFGSYLKANEVALGIREVSKNNGVIDVLRGSTECSMWEKHSTFSAQVSALEHYADSLSGSHTSRTRTTEDIEEDYNEY